MCVERRVIGGVRKKSGEAGVEAEERTVCCLS